MPDEWNQRPGPIDGLTEEQSERIRQAWKDQDREDFRRSFDSAWKSISEAIEFLKDDLVAAKIKTFRDKHYTHLEMNPLGKDPGPFQIEGLGLTYIDLLEFMDRYFGSVFELSRILTGTVFAVEGFSAVHKRRGYDMWRILAGIERNAD